MTVEPATPPVIRSAWVPRPPPEAFEIFTAEIGAWWPLPSHGLFGARSGGLSFRGGKLIEQATDGSETVWGAVLAWEPPKRLLITWHPGRDHDEASQVDVRFEADDGGTRVILTHGGWDTFGTQAMQRRRSYVGPGAWGSVLDHFADGAEARPDAADLGALSTAYDAFFAQATAGNFGEPEPGEWNGDQVLAHMALNDAAIVAACQAIVHQNPTRFENQICQNPAVLKGWIDSCASSDVLIERCRSSARQVLAALARLSPDQLATQVPCYLTHDGEVALDKTVPWQSVAIDAQTTVHIPAHIEQLQALRRL